MSHLAKAALLFLFVCTFFVSVLAQGLPAKAPAHEKKPEVTAPIDAGNEDDALSAGQRSALWLLDQLFEQVKDCNNETFNIRMQAQIADLLWKYDEARARRLFEEAFQAIDALKPEQQDPSEGPLDYDRRCELRQGVLELLGRHDSEWAKKLGDPSDTDLSTDADTSALDAEKANATTARGQPALTRTGSQDRAKMTRGAPNLPRKLAITMWPVSPADLLQQAEMAGNRSEKDWLYSRVARHVLSRNDFEQTLSITQKISPGPSRTSLEAMTRQRAAMAALGKEDFDAAERYIRDLPTLMQRASIYDQMLRALQKRSDFGRAAQLLTEVERLFGSAKDEPDKAYALAIVAGAAARIDPLRGFDVLQSATLAINRVAADGKSRDAVERAHLDPDSLHFDQVLPLLARVDFERARQIARSIDKNELAVLAQLAICRGLLVQHRVAQ